VRVEASKEVQTTHECSSFPSYTPLIFYGSEYDTNSRSHTICDIFGLKSVNCVVLPRKCEFVETLNFHSH